MLFLFTLGNIRTYAFGNIDTYSLISESNTTSSQGGNDNASGHAYTSSISKDGSIVAFESKANDLVPDDTNGKIDVFYKSVYSGQIKRASVSSAGGQSDKDSHLGAISATGRYIVYITPATTLEAGSNTQNRWHTYVHDTKTGNNTNLPYAHVTSLYQLTVSDDGRFIAAVHEIAGLKDINGAQISGGHRINLLDRKTGSWQRLDAPVSEGEKHNKSANINASCDGSFVVFNSGLDNITDETDLNGTNRDIILVDMRDGIKVKNLTHQFNGHQEYPNISCDGRYITFISGATDIATTTTEQQAPGTYNHDQVYVYDRINETYKFVSQTTGGNVMMKGSTSRYTTPLDDGKVYFTASRTVSTADIPTVHIRDTKLNQTKDVADSTKTPTLYFEQIKNGVDNSGRAMIFTSLRSDIVVTANNTKRQVFMVELN